MSEVENMSENACPKNSKPGTENPKTHDAKPKTRNPEPETLLPPESIPVSCFGFPINRSIRFMDHISMRRNIGP